jgi:hypothetical protein
MFVILLETLSIPKHTKESNMRKENVVLYKSKIDSNIEVLVIYPGHPSYKLMKENIFESKRSVSIPEINRILIDGDNLDYKQLLNLEKEEIKKSLGLQSE